MAKISLPTYQAIQGKKEVKLLTFFLVREDAQVLYGFYEEKEKLLFEKLIGINGVGGNTAIMILSSISAEELFHAIRNEDTHTLKKVKGIGAKTAARIILELKDKLGEELGELGVATDTKSASNELAQKKQEALTALVSLGLPKASMEKRIALILKTQGDDVSIEEIIRLALRNS